MTAGNTNRMLVQLRLRSRLADYFAALLAPEFWTALVWAREYRANFPWQ